jgi:hypothetical protein
MKLKKLTAAAAALAMTATMASAYPAAPEKQFTAEAASKYNYAEALQKSMFFYEVQQAGKLPDWNPVSWRDDTMIKEDGTPSDVVDGGWFDAGDHLKFTITNAYTASVLAWGLLQYGDTVKKIGLDKEYRNNLKWGLDYVAACDLGDKVIGTIGDDAFDHVWYGSPEVYLRKFNLKTGSETRPYDEITCCTTVAEMSAALAGGYLVFKDTDPETAENYLKHAKSLFKLANDVWKEKGDNANKDMGVQQKYYNTINNQGKDNFIDELFYAANWMYMATGDEEYLDKCKNEYIPLFPLESQSTEHKFTWGFCWDDTTQGGALLYAINTGDKEWVDHIKHHLDYWINGYGGKQVEQTPDGLSHLNSWGSLRYAEGTAWLAKVACDTIFKDDAALCEKYNNWAKSQMDYAFGDNDLGLSYVVGMGKNPVNIHHRGASGIHDDHWNELGTEDTSGGKWQTEYAHVLYGALEGGPNRDGSFKDDNGSYENTEVAIDYNAGYTACLCAMIEDYGGEILADFPKAETPKWDEWLVSAKINGEGNSYTEIKAWAMNHTAWPARVAKDVEYRYYFDVSELIDAGLSVDQITVASNNQQYGEGEQGYATVSGPYKYEGDASGNTYYASVKFEDGRAIMPTGQSEHRDEVQFRVSIPDAIDGKSTAGAWDPKNDWSYDGLTSKTDDLTLPDALAKHIPMYVNGVLVWGEEPDGTVPTKSDYVPKRSAQGGPGTEDPTKETETQTESKEDPTKDDPTDSTGLKPTLLGDANLDKQVNVADAVLVMQVATNPDKYGRGKTDLSIKEQGEANADVDGKKGLSNNDALLIQKFKLGLIDKFPVES